MMSLVSLWQRQVATRPRAAAVLLPSDTQCASTVSFRQLHRAARDLCSELTGLRSTVPVNRVLVLSRVSIEETVALFGCLLAACPWVPISNRCLSTRGAFIARECGTTVLLDCIGHIAIPQSLSSHIHIQLTFDGVQFHCLGLIPPGQGLTSRRLSSRIPEQEELYVLYTSGSTGQPKGVRGHHSGTRARLGHLWGEWPLSDGDVVGRQARLEFVDSISEVFGSLLAGAPIALLRQPGSHLFVHDLVQCVVTRLTVVPSVLVALTGLEELGARLATVQLWGSSGESLRPALVADLRARGVHAPLLNLYGSTEVAGDVTCCVIEGAPRTVTIGSTMSFAHIQLLIPNGTTQVPDGQVGELVVWGPTVALGYVNQTAGSAFVKNLLHQGRAFRSGDFAVRLPGGGELQLRGRMDNQIKVHGVRLELGDVETTVLRLAPECATGLCALLGKVEAQQPQLWVAVSSAALANWSSIQVDIGASHAAVDGAATMLLRHLQLHMPAHMAISRVVKLPELNQLPSSSKLDRAAIGVAAAAAATTQLQLQRAECCVSQQSSPTTQLVCRVYAELLGKPCAADCQLFEQGGDSVIALRVLHRLSKETDTRLNIEDLLRPACEVGALLGANRSVAAAPGTVDVSQRSAGMAVTQVADRLMPGKAKRQRTQQVQSRVTWSLGRGGNCNPMLEDAVITLAGTTSSQSELCVKWKADLHKCVDASPLVLCEHGERVIIIGSHAHLLVKIRARDGSCAWGTQLGGRIESSAAVSNDGNAVFVGCYDTKLYCIELVDGNIRWSVSTGAEVKCSPTIDSLGSLVVFGSHDGTLRAVAQNDGRLHWSVDTRGAIFGSPSILRAQPDWQDWITANTKGLVLALRAATTQQPPNNHPRERWRCTLPAPVFSSPCITGQKIVCTGCADGVVYGLCGHTGATLWKVYTNEPVFSSPSTLGLSLENRCWVGSHDGILRCIDCALGVTVWEADAHCGAIFGSAFIGYIQAETCDPVMCVVCTTVNGSVFMFDAIYGRLITQYALGNQLFGSPIITLDGIFVPCRDNHLYCLNFS